MQIDGQLIVAGFVFLILFLVISKPWAKEPEGRKGPIPQRVYRAVQFLVWFSVTYAGMKGGAEGIAPAILGVFVAFLVTFLMEKIGSIIFVRHRAIGPQCGAQPQGLGIEKPRRSEIGR
jgi:hypothetical protein